MTTLAHLIPLLLIAVPAFPQDAIALRTVAKKGASIWLHHTVTIHQEVDGSDRRMEIDSEVVRTLHVTVKDVDDKGNLLVETKLVRAQGAVSEPSSGEVAFDSASAAPTEDDGGMGGIAQQLLAGTGKTFTARLSPVGKVLELQAEDILKEARGGGAAGGLSATALTRMVMGAFASVPEQPTAVGAKWQTAEIERGGPVPMKRDLEATLLAGDSGQFTITSAGTLSPAGPDAVEGTGAEAERQRAKMKSIIVKSGKCRGSTKVSRVDGFVIEARYAISFDADVVGGPIGAAQASFEITTMSKRITEAEATPAKGASKTERAKEPARKGDE